MSLSALTISVSAGKLARPFVATISGQSAGSSIDVVSHDGTQGFYVMAGKLYNDALPYAVNPALLRETLAGTGTRDTAFTVQAASLDKPLVDGNAAVATGGTVSVTNSAGAQAHSATASVTGNTLGAVALAATVAMIDNAAALVVPVTGIYIDTITPTIAAGVVTGFVLS